MKNERMCHMDSLFHYMRCTIKEFMSAVTTNMLFFVLFRFHFEQCAVVVNNFIWIYSQRRFNCHATRFFLLLLREELSLLVFFLLENNESGWTQNCFVVWLSQIDKKERITKQDFSVRIETCNLFIFSRLSFLESDRKITHSVGAQRCRFRERIEQIYDHFETDNFFHEKTVKW